MRQNLKKDYLWNTLGSIATACTSFVLTIVIARINNINDLGAYTFAFGMAMIFAMLSFFGGRNFQVTDAKGQFSAREYILQRVIMSFVAIIVAIIFVVLNNYDLYLTAFIFSLLTYKILDSFTDVIAGSLQREHHLWVGGKSGFFKAVIGILLFIIVDLITHNILAASTSFILVYILGIVTYDRYWLNKLNILDAGNRSKPKLGLLFSSTYLMAVILLLQVATVNILRYFVEIFRPGDQGVFGIIILPAFVINLLVAFIISPQLTSLAEMFHNNQIKDFNNTVRKILLITIGLGVVLIISAYFLSIPVIKVFYGYELPDYRWLITLTVLSGVFYALSVMCFSVLTILRRIKIQAVILSFVLIIEIILAFIFGGYFGIEAMVLIYLLAQFIQAVSSYVAYRLFIGGNSSMQDHSTLLSVLEVGRNFNKKLFENRLAICFMRQILSLQSFVMMAIYLPTFFVTGKKYISTYKNIDYENDTDINKLIGYRNKTTDSVRIGKTVWQFWNSGYENIPDGIKICTNRTKEIAKKSGFDYVLITDDNVGDYLYLPDFIMEKYKSGKITKPLFSDILRMALLAKYGGLWVDTTYYINRSVNFNMVGREFLTLHKSIGSFAGNLAMCRWLENFIGSNISGYVLFGFCLAGFYDYWKKQDEAPKEYLFVDYLILVFYKINKNFNKSVKSIKPNFKGVGAMSLLSNYFHNAVIFSKDAEKRLLAQSDYYHKLDFKYSKDEYRNGKPTFYKKFIDEKLDF